MDRTDNNPKGRLAAFDDSPSIPLYLAGLGVVLSSMEMINATIDDPNLTGTTTLLTIVGFIFSVGCRMFGIRTRLPELLGFALAVYIIFGIATAPPDSFDFVHQIAGLSQIDIARVLDWAMVVCSWCLVSDDFVVFCGLPAIASFGVLGSLNVSLNIGYFVLFLFSMTFLLMHHSYRQQRAAAGVVAREEDPTRPVAVQAAVAAGCTLIVLLGSTLLVAPAEAALAKVSLAQAIRNLTAIGGNQAQAPGATVSDDPNLDIGSGGGFDSDTTVIAVVHPGDGNGHYWRARTYDRYTGAGWSSTLANNTVGLVAQPVTSGVAFSVPDDSFPGETPEAGSRVLSTTVHVDGSMSELLSVSQPVGFQVQLAATNVDAHLDNHFELDPSPTGAYDYRTSSVPTPVASDPEVAQRLRRAPIDYPDSIQQLYLGSVANDITTPDDMEYFRRTVRQIFAGLDPGHRTEYDKATAIQQYVSRQALYSLNVAPLPAASDHVRAFLEQTRKGYCDLFSSSMAVLCRVAGIPARVATGFAPGEAVAGGKWQLRSMDKHAWVEIYFPGSGWVTFDPTTDATVDTSTTNAATNVQTRLGSFWRRLVTRTPIVSVLVVVIGLILAVVGFTEYRDRRRARARRDQALARTLLGQTYQQALSAIAAAGLPRRASETPYEYLERARPFLAKVAADVDVPLPAETLDLLTTRFVEARYGAAVGDIDALLGPVDAFIRALWKAQLRLLFARTFRRTRTPAPAAR